MSASFLHLAACAALLFSATACKDKRIPVSSPGDTGWPDFSRYKQTEAFDFTVRQHSVGRFACFDFSHLPGTPPPETHPSLAITVFEDDASAPDDARSTFRYVVTATGLLFDCADIYSHAVQASGSRQLSAQQLADLKPAIAALPDKNTYPPLHQLAIVSLQTDQGYVTRTMPATQLKDIFAVIGNRFDTRKSK